MIGFGAFEALTFDCYGTLIDWETGIAAALRRAGAAGTDDELLESFARHEAALEAGPYRTPNLRTPPAATRLRCRRWGTTGSRRGLTLPLGETGYSGAWQGPMS
jgi:hypothetical protein